MHSFHICVEPHGDIEDSIDSDVFWNLTRCNFAVAIKTLAEEMCHLLNIA